MQFYSRLMFACLLFLGVQAFGLPTLTLPPGITGSQFRVTAFHTGLSYPNSMAVLPDKSLLVCTMDASQPGGDSIFSRGDVVRLADPGNTGTATSVTTVYSGLPFPAQGIRMIGPDLAVVSLTGVGRTQLVFLKAGSNPTDRYTNAGTIELVSPTFDRAQNTTLDTRPTPRGTNSYDVFFSVSDGSTTPGTVTVTGMLTGSVSKNSIVKISVQPTAGTPIVGGWPRYRCCLTRSRAHAPPNRQVKRMIWPTLIVPGPNVPAHPGTYLRTNGQGGEKPALG